MSTRIHPFLPKSLPLPPEPDPKLVPLNPIPSTRGLRLVQTRLSSFGMIKERVESLIRVEPEHKRRLKPSFLRPLGSQRINSDIRGTPVAHTDRTSSTPGDADRTVDHTPKERRREGLLRGGVRITESFTQCNETTNFNRLSRGDGGRV